MHENRQSYENTNNYFRKMKTFSTFKIIQFLITKKGNSLETADKLINLKV